MPKSAATRGYGLLEEFLSKQRASLVNKKIAPHLRQGRILDIGCGNYPLFLMGTVFSEKYGLDKIVQQTGNELFKTHKITLQNFDMENENDLHFNDDYFDVVTMLAVIEHIEPDRVTIILKEIYRVLKPGGMYILTTPAPWTDSLLRFMAKLRLVSPSEIEEHKSTYSHSKISSILQNSNFSSEKLQCGYFEMSMNIWATAIK
jgi:2-polyprenyl-3-methyl-5-hydroxy-6-metoxy-1,4-benzoquinol methylase